MLKWENNLENAHFFCTFAVGKPGELGRRRGQQQSSSVTAKTKKMEQPIDYSITLNN
jgi:hypothetical protein